MKHIGLIGGLSWQSTMEYYRLLNQMIADRHGPHHSALLKMVSLNAADFYFGDDEDKRLRQLIQAAQELEQSNAEMILLCANGVHRFFEPLQEQIKIPMLHIADATAEKIKERKIKKVGLVGVKKTMELPFYKDRLNAHGIETVIPDEESRKVVVDIINDELVLGVFKETSKKKYLEVFDQLKLHGAEGIVLGCTEIPLLIKQADTKLPIFSTTDIHCEAAINAALS